MSQFPSRGEIRGAGSRDVDDTEVNAENCPVLVAGFRLIARLGFRFAKAEMEIPVAVAFRERRLGQILPVVIQILTLVTGFVVWEREIALDSISGTGRRQ